MKTLIINGSPRKDGDTMALVNEMLKHLKGERIIINAYDDKIKPCIDCRYCWSKFGCSIKDDMQIIYDDDFDNVVIASPTHMSGLTSPLIGIAGRFQVYYSAKKFLKQKVTLSEKKGALIIVGGGDGEPVNAVPLGRFMLKMMNADAKENIVFSLKTDTIPASEDKEALRKAREIAFYFNPSLSSSDKDGESPSPEKNVL